MVEGFPSMGKVCPSAQKETQKQKTKLWTRAFLPQLPQCANFLSCCCGRIPGQQGRKGYVSSHLCRLQFIRLKSQLQELLTASHTRATAKSPRRRNGTYVCTQLTCSSSIQSRTQEWRHQLLGFSTWINIIKTMIAQICPQANLMYEIPHGNSLPR